MKTDKPKPTTIYLPPSLRRKIDRQAKKNRRSLTAEIGMMLELYMREDSLKIGH
jgi:hypothetical protein